jgi:hypothetical protein
MTAKTADQVYTSGFCSVGRHEHCRGDFRTATCCCACHQEPAEEPEPEQLELTPPPGPAARLTRAAIALDVDQLPLPLAATAALARLLRAEGAWAADRGDTYPADRAPLLELADLINGDAP